MRKPLRIAGLTFAAAAGLTGAIAAIVFSISGRLPSAPNDAASLDGAPPFRTWPEHDAIYQSADFPIVLAIDEPGAAVRYVGALHTSDADHPQLAEVERVFESFEPTIVLLEGRARLFDWPLRFANGHSEVAFTYALARSRGLPCFSLEPPYDHEVAALLDRWPADHIACYFIARGFIADGGPQSDDPESVLAPLIAKRTDADGLRGVIASVAQFDEAWMRITGDGPDWRTAGSLDAIQPFGDIGNDSRELRGEHMVRAIATLARSGERVMAVVGASHTIRHEPTLRWLVETRD